MVASATPHRIEAIAACVEARNTNGTDTMTNDPFASPAPKNDPRSRRSAWRGLRLPFHAQVAAALCLALAGFSGLLASCASSDTVAGDEDVGAGDDGAGRADTGGDASDDTAADEDASPGDGGGAGDCPEGCGADEECKGGECVPVETDDCVDEDGDGFGEGCEAGPDCDDGNAQINPGAAEQCDARDNDCDDERDEGDVCGGGCPPLACDAGARRCGLDGRPEVCEEDLRDCGRWVAGAECGPRSFCEGGVCLAVGEDCRDPDGDGRGKDCERGEDCDERNARIYVGAPELCDGVDNDCDGEIDEDYPRLGDACSEGVGACEVAGSFQCAADAINTRCVVRESVAPGDELCGNGEDDDCDGEVDEGFEELGSRCDVVGDTCEEGGVQRCSEDLTELVCVEAPVEGREELCGNSEDDDCDGEFDEGFDDLGESCVVGIGACERRGVLVCGPDLLETACSARPAPANDVDLCGNGEDDDCDGDVDEGYDDLGDGCEVGVGACAATGTIVCAADRRETRCDAVAGEPGPEICDDQDNDCDGEIDEGDVCSDSCDDDALEPNDDRDGATDLTTIDDDFVDAVACRDNSDWYLVEIGEPGDRFVANLTFTHEDGDLDLRLYRGEARVASSASITDDERIVHDVVETGIFYLQVVHYTGDTRVPYRLGWQIERDDCSNDGREPNDGRDSASVIERGDSLALTLCPGDEDWFTLAEGTEGALRANLLFAHADGDVDMELVRGDEAEAFAYSVTDNETATVDDAMDVAIRVFRFGSGPGVEYRLSVPAADDCLEDDDVFEENDDRDHAVPIEAGVLVNATMCRRDVDWYSLGRLSEGTIVDIEADFLHDEGDIDVILHRAGSEVSVQGAYSIDDDEFLSVTVEASDEYLLRVTRIVGTRDNAQDYRLRYSER